MQGSDQHTAQKAKPLNPAYKNHVSGIKSIAFQHVFTRQKKKILNSPSLFQALKKYTIEDVEKHYRTLLELQCVQFVMKACVMFIRRHSKCHIFLPLSFTLHYHREVDKQVYM